MKDTKDKKQLRDLTFEEYIKVLDNWSNEEMSLSTHYWLVGRLLEKLEEDKNITRKGRKAIRAHANLTMCMRSEDYYYQRNSGEEHDEIYNSIYKW